jgi:hypothetical protein
VADHLILRRPEGPVSKDGRPPIGPSFETHRYAMLLSMRMRDFAWLFDIVKWDARTASRNGAGQGGRSERYFDAESVLSMATAS